MGLSRCIDFLQNQQKELTIFNSPNRDAIREELLELFETQNVTITTAQTASRAPAVVVLSNTEGVLTRVDISMVQKLLTEPTGSGTGIADAEYETLLAHLKESTFTSTDKQQLLYASREIEDRARRVGAGTLHAGFQRVSLMVEQSHVYQDLTGRGVTVHAYGIPDATPPDFGSATIHTVSNPEIERTWFVIFDGDGKDTQKTAMLAQQREDESFFGAWTYDTALVDELLAYLSDRYLSRRDDE